MNNVFVYINICCSCIIDVCGKLFGLVLILIICIKIVLKDYRLCVNSVLERDLLMFWVVFFFLVLDCFVMGFYFIKKNLKLKDVNFDIYVLI